MKGLGVVLSFTLAIVLPIALYASCQADCESKRCPAGSEPEFFSRGVQCLCVAGEAQ